MKLVNGEAIHELEKLPEGSVDAVVVDPPYGTTTCKWDSVIPLEPMWEQLRRITKPDSAIVMTAAQPFTSELIMSNLSMFKYSLVWKKSKICHFAQAPYRFLTEHEDVVVFSRGGTSSNAKTRMRYRPQGVIGSGDSAKGKGSSEHRRSNKKQDDYFQIATNYPKSILDFPSVAQPVHPTEKPVELMAYLIRSYTDPRNVVLDFTMGSGTTGVACVQTERDFIGIELDAEYYELAKTRIREAQEAGIQADFFQ